MLVDTHAHLDFTDEINEWLERAKGAGVSKIICVGTSVDASRKCAQTAQKIPLERMLLETDSPFLAPHPLRGSQNEPKNVKIIASFIASLRNISVEEIAEAASRNAEAVFKLKDNF